MSSRSDDSDGDGNDNKDADENDNGKNGDDRMLLIIKTKANTIPGRSKLASWEHPCPSAADISNFGNQVCSMNMYCLCFSYHFIQVPLNIIIASYAAMND